ncbi:hypothetical protein GGI22_004205, partial [Coemansia erecta]
MPRHEAPASSLLTESPTNFIAQKQCKPQHRYALGADIDDSRRGNLGVTPGANVSTHANKRDDQNINGSLYDRHLHPNAGHMMTWADDKNQQERLDRATRHPTMVFDHSPILRASTLIGTSFSDSNLGHDIGDSGSGDRVRHPECHSDSEASGSPSHQTRYDRANACKPRRMRSLTESSSVQKPRY